MNELLIMGNLTRDPQISKKTGEDGKELVIAKYDVAVTRRQKKQGGPDSDFFHCTSFGSQAEFIEKYFKKGSRVLVAGRVENNNYTNKNGEKVYGFSVIVRDVEFAEKKNNSAENTTELVQEENEDLPY